MLIAGNNRMSRVETCLDAALHFLLSREEGMAIAKQQKRKIEENWKSVCDEAELNDIDRNLLWGRQFFNPYVFQN